MTTFKRFLVCVMVIMAMGFVFQVNAASAATKMTFYIQWVYSYADHIGIYMAVNKGYFKEQGLDVSIEHVKGSNAVVKVIGTKKDDLVLGMADALAVLKGVVRGVPIKSVTALYQANPAAIISLKKSNIQTVKDLVGKKLADSPTSTTYHFIKAGLAKANLDFSQVKFMAVEGGATKETLLLTGKVDSCGGTANGQAVNIAAKGHEVNLITMQDMGIKGYGMCIIANENMLKEKDVINKFITAYAKGVRFQREHPDEAATIFQQMVPERTLSIVKKKNQMNIKLMESDDALKNGFGHQTKAAWGTLQDILFENKVIESKVDSGKFFTNDFIGEASKSVF